MLSMDVDFSAVLKESNDGGLPHGALLAAFAEAVVRGKEQSCARARDQIMSDLGLEELVDAAAIVAHFEMAVRVADSTGIPLDPPVLDFCNDLAEELGFNRFGSARNTFGSGDH